MRSIRQRSLAIASAAVFCFVVVAIVVTRDRAQSARILFGFNDNSVTQHLLSPAEDAELVARTGATVDRIQFGWRDAEPQPGDFRLAPYDAIYRAMRARGIRPILIFGFAPAWARDPAVCGAQPDCLAPPAREHVADAARVVTLLVRRYPGLAAIEIWNEPNTAHFWSPAPEPIAYVELLRACAIAIRKVPSRVPILGGSVVNTSGAGGSVLLPEFLSRIFRAGAEQWMDGLSVHAYPDPAEDSGRSAVAAVGLARAAVQATSRPDLPIWITETGLSTTGPQSVDSSAQARRLTTLIQRFRRFPGVRAVLVHTLIEPDRLSSDSERGFGVLGVDRRRKPSYCALSEQFGGTAHC